jgi:hypothetical protein
VHAHLHQSVLGTCSCNTHLELFQATKDACVEPAASPAAAPCTVFAALLLISAYGFLFHLDILSGSSAMTKHGC